MSDPSEPIRLEVESVNDAIDESDETTTPVEKTDERDETGSAKEQDNRDDQRSSVNR